MSGIKKFTVNNVDASIAMASDSNAGFMSSEQYTFIEGIRGTGEGDAGIDASIIKYDNKTTGMDPVFDASTMESVGWTSGKPVTVDTAIDVLAKKQADLETYLGNIDDEPTAGSENLVKSGGVAEKISQLGQEVTEITGAPAVSVWDNSNEQVGTIVTLTFHNGGNYGNWRYVLLPMTAYKGRTLRIVPLSTSYGTQYIFLKDNVLTNNADVNACTGIEATSTVFVQTDVTIPSDCNYMFVRTQNVSTENHFEPQSLTVLATASALDTKVDKVEGKGLSTNDFSDADKAKLDGLQSGVVKYGVKWSVSDFSDLGTRIFDSIGKTATIGVGNTNGSSSFDSIFPWAGMKRCNINTNANGAKIVTFEGETGFALDGSNGDVFVRIPKFKTDHYTENGYEYVVIGAGYVHPAFIEDGVELDEIFVGAFEAAKVSDALYSKAGVIPANNMTGSEFLAAAKERGSNYTLADMRSVDAIWRLMVVEFGCRNSNQVLGYGYSDFCQPSETYSSGILYATVAASQSNTITIGKPSSNSFRLQLLTRLGAGNNITICNGNQTTIVAQRKITAVTCASTADNIVITFDGSPVDITTAMFVGNAASDTNFCETIGSSYKLNWHTGRTSRPTLSGSGLAENTTNPCRYRWIENPVGNVWQFLPDITFNDRQMYVCSSMKDYTFLKYTSPYVPIGPVLPLQSSNGNKNDVNTSQTPNYWIIRLLNPIFAKGNSFASAFDETHDGSITSAKSFGGYYYLNTGLKGVVNGGGFDHLYRCNMLTNRAQIASDDKWFLYGGRLMYKNLD